METKSEDTIEDKKKSVKVRILYKSGNSIDLEASRFSITNNNNGKLIEASWADTSPRIMYISLSDVEGVFELVE
jgi:hypothetical protein